MDVPHRARRPFALLFPLALLAAPPAFAQSASAPIPTPKSIQTSDPWLYRGSDIPQDKEWIFGELPNGLRYAVRKNGVPPDQVSIRIRIDAGSLNEREDERGFAHLIEHLTFRQSRYLGEAQAIPIWQRLGATFGSDTNAETSPTQTVYKLDLPGINPGKLDESMKILSGMIREPTLSEANVRSEVPIVLAEMRERGGPGQRVGEATRSLFFAGQPLATRTPIGIVSTLEGARQNAVRAFHARWYRPENTVIVAAGDVDPMVLAAEVEQYFGDWKGTGRHVTTPSFGEPKAPAGADPANPVGETKILVEPDLPANVNYAILRPWNQVVDNLEYNRGLMLDTVAQSIINRRLEARARSGGSFLFASVSQDDVSRSADGTFVSVTPLSDDWQGALADVRSVIADARATAPTQEEIDREVAELDVAFASSVDERSVMAGSKLADDLVNAIDIRETVASPEAVLRVFRQMKPRFTPQAVLDHTRSLFKGTVTRAALVTPKPNGATAGALRSAMLAPVQADGSSRLAAADVSFAKLPAIGTPGTVVSQQKTGILDIEQVTLSNGIKALIWANDAEPGRVSVKVRFGSGYRAFAPEDAAYATLGNMALVGAGVGPLGQEELDRISTGRKMGFDFDIGPAAFTFAAQTRSADLDDQLYLFAAKLAMPRWDENPVLRAQAAARLAYESYATNPGGVLARDLNWEIKNKDPRFATPDPAAISQTTPAEFRRVWEPLLKQGPVEVIVIGDFDRAKTIAALERTFGALPPRTPIPSAALGRGVAFPKAGADTVVLTHRGDANQAAAVIAWPTGGGVTGLPESRQLEILTQIFNLRLMDEMREKLGASYAPQVASDWPVDLDSGGTIMAVAQLQPKDVPAFFQAADIIAHDLAANPPTADELARVTEPLKQLISRASTGNGFWLYQVEGATMDPRRVKYVRSLLADYSQTTPARMQALAARYLASRPGFRLAVIPAGQMLATALPTADGAKASLAG